MFGLALRLHRVGVLGYAAVGVLTGLINGVGFRQIAGATPAERETFARQVEIIARQVSYILPLPARVDTVGGYLQWRFFGAMPLLFAIWALIAGSGVIRGEEERGLLDQWLSAGISRIRLAAVRLLAFAVAAAMALAIIALVTQGGVLLTGESLSFLGLIEQALAVLGCTMVIFSLGLLVSQFLTTRRAAGGWTAILMVTLFMLNSLSRSVDGLLPYRWLSPFHYVDRSNPMVPGGHLDLTATLTLVATALVLATLAALAFQVRDLWAGLIVWRRRQRAVQRVPAANPLLAIPVLSRLYEHRLELIAWSAATALFAYTTVQPTRSVVEAFASVPGLRAIIGSGHGTLEQVYIGNLWFGGVAAFLLAAYAITQVAQWSAEDAEGRLEMTLSAPVPRWRVVVERALALTLASIVLIAAGGLFVLLAARSAGIDLARGPVVLASILLLPFVLTFGAVGAAIASYRPRLAMGSLSLFAIISYLIIFIGPLFKVADWVLHLSVFRLYGSPLTEGVYTRGLQILLAATAVGFVVALAAMQRREVGR